MSVFRATFSAVCLPQFCAFVDPKVLVFTQLFLLLLALRQSFETFIKNVPLNKWKTFMRALGLTDHDIDIAEADEKGVNDQHFHMLRTWLTKKGKEATLNILLDTLCAIELRGVMKSVQDELISQGLYCYEE